MTTVDLGYRPRTWQQAVHRDPARVRVVVLHRRAGKTTCAAAELVSRALSCRLPSPGYLYVAPYGNQARRIMWPILCRLVEPLRRAGVAEVREADATIELSGNGAVIRCAGADNADSLRGLRIDGLVVDETKDVASSVWTDVLQPATSDRLGWAMFLGTPSGIDLLSELHGKALATPGWSAHRYTVHDTGAIDPDEVRRLERDMPPMSFAREYLCDFAASADDQLIGLTDVLAATRRTVTERDVAGLPLIMGVDPARFGSDRSVVVLRQGIYAYPASSMVGVDNMTLAARVASTIEHRRPDAVFVDSGAGAGVIDRLRQLGHDCIEVPFGGTALMDARFVNRRSEMWWTMAEWVKGGGAVDPADRALHRELATPTYKFDARGRIALESKDDIRKRLPDSGSPDIADALALTFAAPVVKRTPLQEFAAKYGGQTRAQKAADYDPMANV
jgi:hypothetical protein